MNSVSYKSPVTNVSGGWHICGSLCFINIEVSFSATVHNLSDLISGLPSAKVRTILPMETMNRASDVSGYFFTHGGGTFITAPIAGIYIICGMYLLDK